jgi:hypothetical protein
MRGKKKVRSDQRGGRGGYYPCTIPVVKQEKVFSYLTAQNGNNYYIIVIKYIWLKPIVIKIITRLVTF